MNLNVSRQTPLVAEIAFSYTDLTSGVSVDSGVNMPPNSVVIGGELVVDVPFNTAGGTTPTDTLSIGDADNDTRYANAVNIRTAGRTALTLSGYKYTAKKMLTLKWAQNADKTTDPTQGAGRIKVMYVIEGRASEVQP